MRSINSLSTKRWVNIKKICNHSILALAFASMSIEVKYDPECRINYSKVHTNSLGTFLRLFSNSDCYAIFVDICENRAVLWADNTLTLLKT